MPMPWMYNWKLVVATILGTILSGTSLLPGMGLPPQLPGPTSTPATSTPVPPGPSTPSATPTSDPNPTQRPTPTKRPDDAPPPKGWQKPSTGNPQQWHRTGEVIVALRQGTDRQAVLDRVAASIGLARPTVVRQLATGSALVRVPGSAEALRSALLQAPEVTSATLNGRLTRAADPTDPLWGQQWNLKNPTGSTPRGGIGVETAWNRAYGDQVRIAVLDSGKTAHPDLSGAWLGGHDFVSDTYYSADGNGRDTDATDPGDQCQDEASSWHGSHVSGIIAARQNSIGISGVAPHSRVVPVRVLGQCGGTLADIVDAMVWAAGGRVQGVPTNQYPARILNMSLSYKTPSTCNPELQMALAIVRKRGVLPVVASGNMGGLASDYAPGNCAGAFTVAASAVDDSQASYSNRGGPVKLAAPGGDWRARILSTVVDSPTTNNGRYVYRAFEGTSMATPHVAGVAALALQLNPRLTLDQLEQLLLGTTRAGGCTMCGRGVVDAAAVVAAIPVVSSATLQPPADDAAADVPRTVILRGAGFTGATDVRIGNRAAIFTRVSDTELRVTLPTLASGEWAIWVVSPLSASASRVIVL